MARRKQHRAWALAGLLTASGAAWGQSPALSALPATALTPIPLSSEPPVAPAAASTPSENPTVDLGVGKPPPPIASPAPPAPVATPTPVMVAAPNVAVGPIAPAWRWYGWGTVNTGLPLAAPMASTSPPPLADPKAAAPSPASTAVLAPPNDPTWTVPVEAATPIPAPTLELRLENPSPAPVPAPPVADPFVPVHGAKLSTPRGAIARASSSR